MCYVPLFSKECPENAGDDDCKVYETYSKTDTTKKEIKLGFEIGNDNIGSAGGEAGASNEKENFASIEEVS